MSEWQKRIPKPSSRGKLIKVLLIVLAAIKKYKTYEIFNKVDFNSLKIPVKRLRNGWMTTDVELRI